MEVGVRLLCPSKAWSELPEVEQKMAVPVNGRKCNGQTNTDTRIFMTTHGIVRTGSPYAHISVRSCKTGEGFKRLLLPRTLLLPFTWVEPMGMAQKQLTYVGFSIALLGSSSAESNPAIACQVSRL